jgi:glycosyltransferase involved in cell wall biosynthesis
LFLGRIHEKKGCDLLIQSFASVVKTEPTLHLVMAGPDQTGWVDGLKRLAQDIGVEDRVSWPGMLRGEMKWGAFYCAEAFVLPSHQENFGVAVAESLGCGRPVLISNKVNIWREIEAAGAGIVETDSLAGTARLLSRWLAMRTEDRQEMGVRAQQLFRRQFTVEVMAESLLNIIRERRYGSALASVT